LQVSQVLKTTKIHTMFLAALPGNEWWFWIQMLPSCVIVIVIIAW